MFVLYLPYLPYLLYLTLKYLLRRQKSSKKRSSQPQNSIFKIIIIYISRIDAFLRKKMPYSAAFKVGVKEKFHLAFMKPNIYTNVAEIFLLEGKYESEIQTTTSRERPDQTFLRQNRAFACTSRSYLEVSWICSRMKQHSKSSRQLP